MQRLIIFLLFVACAFASISDNETVRESFQPNGSTTTYRFTFKCNSADDVLVYAPLTSTGDPTAALVVDTDYTIAPTSSSYLNGGVVTIDPALSGDYTVKIVRRIKQSQETAQGAITPTSIVAALDKATRQIQDAEDRKDRSLHIPESDSVTFNMEIPNSVDRGGKNLGFDSDGNVVVTDSSGTFTAITAIWEDVRSKSPRHDVRAYGADNTGSASSQTAIQNAINAAVDGDTVWFPPGTYIIDSAFDDIEKDISLVGDNAILSASAIITEPVFTWDTRADFVVSGLTYDGEETQGSFSAPSESIADVYGLIYLDTCDNVKVSNISGLECRNIIKLNGCTSCTVDNIHHIGVLAETDDDANFHVTIQVNAGTDNKVSRVHSENGGTALTGSGTTERLVVSSCSGTTLWDNGVYISSGAHCVIKDCVFVNFETNQQYGIKVRGSYHVIANNVLTNMRNGIRVTGLTDLIGGNSCVIVGNVVKVYTGLGISVWNVDDGPYLYNISIANNAISNGSGTTSTGEAIRARVIKGLSVTGNVIMTNVESYSVLIAGVSGDKIEDVVVSNNIMTDVVEGIRITEADNVNVAGNVFEDCSSGVAIGVRNVTNSIFMGNSYPERDKILIRDDETYANHGNAYIYNFGTNAIDSSNKILSYSLDFNEQPVVSYENETVFYENDVVTR